MGTQAHPEFKSRPDRPAPLFCGLVKAALDRRGSGIATDHDSEPGIAIEPVIETEGGIAQQQAVAVADASSTAGG